MKHDVSGEILRIKNITPNKKYIIIPYQSCYDWEVLRELPLVPSGKLIKLNWQQFAHETKMMEIWGCPS